MYRVFARHKREKLFAGILSVAVIALLIIAGPANALKLSLDGFKTSAYEYNEAVSFKASIDIENTEILPLENLSLKINDETVCTFTPSGTPINGCTGITIKLLSEPMWGYGYGYSSYNDISHGSDRSSKTGNYDAYGYGYGYGYQTGRFSYQISVAQPSTFLNVPGNNDFQLLAATLDDTLFSRVEKIAVKSKPSSHHHYYYPPANKTTIFPTPKENENKVFQNLTVLNKPSNNDEQEQEKVTPGKKNGMGRITGAVVGVLGITGSWILGIIVLLLVISGAIGFRIARMRQVTTSAPAELPSAPQSTTSSFY